MEQDAAAELDRLQAENEKLRAALDKETRSMGRGRSIVVWALIVVGCLAAASTTLGLWARTTALDTETYLDTVAPLTQDPEVSVALAQTIVDEVFRDADIEQRLTELLPSGLGFLAPPVGSAVRDFSVETAERLISSDEFRGVWETLNRVAHTQAVAVLTGRDAIVITQEGAVALDLTEAASAIRAGLEEAGLGDLVPPPRQEGAVVVLFNSQQLGVLQATVDLLDLAYWALPILTIVTLGAAVLVSRDRRRTWVRVGLSLAIAMAGALLFLDLARGSIVDGIEDPINQAGVAGLWDQLIHNLATAQAALLVLSLLVAGAAFLLGPHRYAESFRASLNRRIAGWRGQHPSGRDQDDSIGRFLNEHLSAVRLFGVVVALVFMFVWPRLTVGIVVVAVIGLIIYLALVETARHDPGRVGAGDGDAIDLRATASEMTEGLDQDATGARRPK